MRKIKLLAMALVAMFSVCSFVACSSDDDEKNAYWVDVDSTSANYDNNPYVKAVVDSLKAAFKSQYGTQAMTSSEANGHFETLCANIVSTVTSKKLSVFSDTYCTLALRHSSTSADNYPTTATKQITFTSNAERSNSSMYLFITTTNVMEMVSKVDLEFYDPTTKETVKTTITSADNRISETACKNFVSTFNSAITGDPYFVYYYTVSGVNKGEKLTATATWTVDSSKAASYSESDKISFAIPKVYYFVSDGIKVDSNISSVKLSTSSTSTLYSSLSESRTSATMTKPVDF